MNVALKLHTFARRTCMNRHDCWTGMYGELVRDGRHRVGFGDCTDEAYAIFPRCNVLQAVIDQIEMLNADALPDVEELRSLLVEACQTPTPASAKPVANVIRDRAMAEERANLASVFQLVTEAELAKVQPLFYRRTLSPDEVQFWDRMLEQTWGVSTPYWHPIDEKSHPSLVALKIYDVDAVLLRERLGSFWQLYTCLTHSPEAGRRVVFRRDRRHDRVQQPH